MLVQGFKEKGFGKVRAVYGFTACQVCDGTGSAKDFSVTAGGERVFLIGSLHQGKLFTSQMTKALQIRIWYLGVAGISQTLVAGLLPAGSGFYSLADSS